MTKTSTYIACREVVWWRGAAHDSASARSHRFPHAAYLFHMMRATFSSGT